MELTEKEKTTLLDIVKKTIMAKFSDKEMPKLTLESQTLKERRGAFVTLKNKAIYAAVSVT